MRMGFIPATTIAGEAMSVGHAAVIACSGSRAYPWATTTRLLPFCLGNRSPFQNGGQENACFPKRHQDWHSKHLSQAFCTKQAVCLPFWNGLPLGRVRKK